MPEYTNYPNGLTSMGVPVMSGIPLPFSGNYFFVDPVNGVDGNIGTPSQALKTLSGALARCTAGKNDVIFLIGNGTTAGSARESATLAWNKDATHLIGICGPTQISQRARIAATSGVNFTPLVNVTAKGCYFGNLSAFAGYDSAVTQVCWVDAGERNYYGNVSFQGMGHATAGAQAGGRSLVVGGAGGLGENTFEHCTIGVDTVARTAANASLQLLNSTPRNIFRGCVFPAYATAATPLFVTATAVDRMNMFENCSFINSVKSGTGTAMTSGFNAAGAIGGLLLLKDCTFVGATDIEGTPSNNIFIDGAAPTAATSQLAVNNA